MGGDLAGELEQIAHHLAFGDQIVAHRVGTERGAQGSDLASQVFPFLRLAQRHHHFVRAEGFVQIVVGPFAHGGEGGVFVAIGAHHDDQRAAVTGAVLLEERQSVHPGHAHIAQNHVRVVVEGGSQCLLGVTLGMDVVPGLLEQESKRLAKSWIVVNYQ